MCVHINMYEYYFVCVYMSRVYVTTCNHVRLSTQHLVIDNTEVQNTTTHPPIIYNIYNLKINIIQPHSPTITTRPYTSYTAHASDRKKTCTRARTHTYMYRHERSHVSTIKILHTNRSTYYVCDQPLRVHNLYTAHKHSHTFNSPSHTYTHHFIQSYASHVY